MLPTSLFYWQWSKCIVFMLMPKCNQACKTRQRIILDVDTAIRGGTDLERGYGDVRPWRPPFHASPAAARNGPISSKRVSSQDPILRKFWKFSLNSLNFHPNFSSQAPKFWNFQLTSPQIWIFSAHKPPFSDANVSSQAPHFGNPGRTPLPEKKLSAPPPGLPSLYNAPMWREKDGCKELLTLPRIYQKHRSNKTWLCPLQGHELS